MKRSVYMITSGKPSSSERDISPFVSSQARAMRQSGWEVVLGLIPSRTSIRSVSATIAEFRRNIARVEPGVVHAQYGSVVARIAASSAGNIPLVVSFCGADLLGAKNPGVPWMVRDRLGRALGLSAAGRAAAIIVKSQNLLDALPKRLRSRAIVLPNGVDTEVFRPMEQAEACRILGWSETEFVVLFNSSKGYNRRVKNLELAKAAVSEAKRVYSDIRLQTIDNSEHAEVPLIMNAANCLLLTSSSEGSPNVVKEAMACNLPVVAVPCGDVVQRLINTYPSYVVPYHPGFLSEAILNIAKIRMRSNGSDEIERQQLSNPSVAAVLEEIYVKAQCGQGEEWMVKDLSCVE
jgi:teichuronic acid biosynthesis glycosyltransferase TuaC